MSSGVLTQLVNAAATAFNVTIPTNVPPAGELPSLSSVFQRFGSEKQLTSYIEDPQYSTDPDVPLVYGAIVLTSPGPSWGYKLAFNRTFIPDTRFPVFPFDVGIQTFQNELVAGGSVIADNDDVDEVPGLSPAGLPGPMSYQQLMARYILKTGIPSTQRFGAPVNGSMQSGNMAVGSVWDAALNSITQQSATAFPRAFGFLATYSNLRNVAQLFPNADAVGAQLDADLMRLFDAERMTPIDIEMAAFPVNAYTNNPFYSNAGSTFAIFFVIFFALQVLFLTRGVVDEKESKIREGMRMMGLGKSSLFASWALFYILIEIVVSLGMTLVGSINVWAKSDFGSIFLLFFLFGVSVIAFSFLLSVFFSKARLASVLGAAIWFGLYFPSTGLSDDSTESTRLAAALASPTAFVQAFNNILTLENAEVGVVSTTLDTKINNVSFAQLLGMLVLDIFLYSVLAWYLDEVWPSEFGVPRPFYFPFTADYWKDACGCCFSRQRVGDSESLTAADEMEQDDSQITMNENVEPADSELKHKASQGKCVKVRGLKKVFSTPDGDKVAVDGLNVTMYEGQITCLLGHNGAGKTTTISMMSGLIAPTEGDAQMYGKSVRHDLDAIRADMGVCPQHDVLWGDLTVKEHLHIFAGIKRIPPADVNKAIDDIIAEVGLTEKVDSYSSTLSGGQKRKLSVAIALIGGSKIVFLDEPTSGMDPYSRRSTWQILQNAREGRVMVLTTHFMDEADLLGDRIAIMAEGQLRCAGSPIFLKSKYGVGYNLTLIKAESGADVPAIKDVVQKHVPAAEMYSNVGAELSYRLPLAASAKFPNMFDALDSKLSALGIETYGVSVTTMEEVFLQVAAAGHTRPGEAKSTRNVLADKSVAAAGGAASESTPLAPGQVQVSNKPSLEAVRSKARSIQKGAFARHFVALFRKRVAYFYRDYKAICLQMMVPIITVIVGMSIAQTGASFEFPDLAMDLEQYNQDTAGDVLTQPVPYFQQRATGGPGDDLRLRSTAADSDITALFAANFQPQYGEWLAQSAEVPDQFGFFSALQAAVASREADPSSALNPIMVNMSTSLLAVKDNFEASMYGAYVFGDPLYVSQLNQTAGSGPPAWGVLSNSSATFSSATFLNILTSNAIKAKDGAASGVGFTFDVLPFTERQRQRIESVTGLVAAIITVIGMSFVPASYATFVVKEREINAKHQQLISGVSIPAYWLSTWIFDYLTYLVPGFGSVLVAVAYDINNFVDSEDDRLAAFLLAFIFYGFMASSYAYMLSFAFKSHSRALTVLILLGFIDFLFVLSSFLLSLFTSTCEAERIIRRIFMFSPGFALGNSLIKLSSLTSIKVSEVVCDGGSGAELADASKNPYTALDLNAVGENLLYMSIVGFAYFLIAVAIDTAQSYPSVSKAISDALQPLGAVFSGCLAPYVPLTEKDRATDPDVIEENQRCDAQAARAGHDENDVILLSHLRKVYPGGKVAVRDMSFGVPVGQVFGFLGINGAGKTSTLKMLSGDVVPSSGTAKIAGFDIVKEQPDVRRLLGYCPQFDALLELLTVREHLELYARIKGVREEKVNSVVIEKMTQMTLTQYENKKAGTLSGGNKRKLSVAIALIGNPPVIILDEPSTGMDPVARRFMWDVIADIATKRKESSIILTTHSMEECEALCQNVGIMVGGKLRAMGSIQHLKHTHGDGFTLQIGLADPKPEAVEAAKNKIMQTLQGMQITNGRVAADQVRAVCNALGTPAMASEFHPKGSAWALHAGMVKDGSVPAAKVASWWADEDGVAKLTAYVLQEAFPGSTRIERHGSKLRFKLPNTGAPLGQLFRKVEDRKAALNVTEYSLSQTTVEEIFNQFAAQQDEEKGVARGMESAATSRAAAPAAAAPAASNPIANKTGKAAQEA